MTPLIWDSIDAEALRIFLETPSGQRFIQTLQAQRPRFSGNFDPTARIVEGAKIEGYEDCLAEIPALLVPPETPEPASAGAYEDLDAPIKP